MADFMDAQEMPRAHRGAIILGVLVVIAAIWTGFQVAGSASATVTTGGDGTPNPPPHAGYPFWAWPRAEGAGQENWLPEPWGGSGPIPDYLGGAMGEHPATAEGF